MQINSISGVKLSYDFEGEINESTEYCPLNNTRGKRLLRKTLANHLLPKYWELIVEPGYYFCPNKDCPLIYFNRDADLVFSQSDLRTTVMHKMSIGAEFRPICYCKNVLEKTIIEELTIKKCCDSLKDIQKFTEANTGKDCSITNPTGRCCGKQVMEIMDWVKEEDDLQIDGPLMEEAMSCCDKIVSTTEANEY